MPPSLNPPLELGRSPARSVDVILPLALAIGSVFGLVGAATAFLITYAEYQRHGLARRQLWVEALTTAAIAFAVLLILTLIVVLVLFR